MNRARKLINSLNSDVSEQEKEGISALDGVEPKGFLNPFDSAEVFKSLDAIQRKASSVSKLVKTGQPVQVKFLASVFSELGSLVFATGSKKADKAVSDAEKVFRQELDKILKDYEKSKK